MVRDLLRLRRELEAGKPPSLHDARSSLASVFRPARGSTDELRRAEAGITALPRG